MSKPTTYSLQVRERALRMVFEHAHEHPSRRNKTCDHPSNQTVCSNK